jgi:Domain of unknown function (DUF4158)
MSVMVRGSLDLRCRQVEREAQAMRREWELEDLIECWTLDEAEFGLLANKTGATRLGFALVLKFFELEARVPRREDIPRAAVEFVAGQVKVGPDLFGQYRWSGSTIKYHRGQIRDFHGFVCPEQGRELEVGRAS